MYRRSPAESGYLLYYPQFAGICQAGSDDFVSCLFPVCFLSVSYFSVKVAQAVSLQSQAPQPLIST